MSPIKYFDQPLPKTFRQKEIADILSIVTRGESLQLVSPSGSGKSLLIQQLVDQSTEDLTIISLDFNLLADKTPTKALSFFESFQGLSLSIQGETLCQAPISLNKYSLLLCW